jgi:hypothetical protein
VFKILFAWRDHPQLSAEECERHYRAVHMVLAREAFDQADGFIAIAYNRVNRHFVNDRNEPRAIDRDPDIDAFVEIWFEDRVRFQRALEHPNLPLMFEDHGNFMDVTSRANIRVYEVDEAVYHGRRPT